MIHEDGSARRLVIGHCPKMSLDAARKQASIEIGDLFDGTDIGVLLPRTNSDSPCLAPFFKSAMARQLISASPLAGMSAPDKPEERKRKLPDAELKAFWLAIEQINQWGPPYRLLLLTAQRREEVSSMRWSEIAGDIWSIPGECTKNGEEHIVHLARQAFAILPARDLIS